MACDKTAFEQQQGLAQLYGAQGSIIWDLYHTNDKEVLEDKLKYLLPNNLENVQDLLAGLTDPKQIKDALDAYDKIQKENDKLAITRKTIAEAIWNQRKFCEGNLLMSIIFVLHTPNIIEPYTSTKHTKNYTYHPLFRVRKCRKNNSSDNCCSIFVDSVGRVYQNWQDYILNNKLPQGIIIAPQKGVYKFDANNKVILEYLLTPSSSAGEKILKVADYSATALGVGTAIALPIVTLAAPLAAIAGPVVLGCTVIGGLVGGWSIGRSSANLADRGKHEQSLSLGNREARSSWMNIATGAVGIGASGVSRGLTAYAAAEATAPRALQRAIIGINGLSIATSGIGIGNSFIDAIMKYRDNESVTSLDVLELSASLVLFTHSICNLHIAAKVMKSGNKSVSFYNLLSEQKTCNIRSILFHAGKVVGNMNLDIIRPLKKIPNNKFSNDILDIMKDIQNNSVRCPQKIQQNIQTDNTELISPNSSDIDPNIAFFIIDLIKTLKEIFFVGSDDSFVDVLLNIAEKVTENALLEVIRMAQNYAFEIIAPLQKKLHMIPFESFIWELFKTAEQLCGPNRKVTIDFLKLNSRRIFEFLKDFYGSLTSSSDKEIKCKICGGYYNNK